MKNKLLSLAGLLAVFNLNAIEIGPTGSGAELSGFADYAISSQGGNTSPVQTAQVELNLDFAKGPVSFSMDLDFTSTGDGSTGGNLEEAVVTYAFSDNLSMSVGKMLSYLGFEAFDPTNMYQFSYAYDYASGGGQDVYDAYADGMSIDYGTDSYSIGIWTDMAEQSSWEYALAYTGIENLTVKAILADYANDADEILTIWASYQIGDLLIGFEYADDDKNTAAPGTAGVYTDDNIEAYLLMANYAITDSAAITVRYSEADYIDASTVTVDKFTISPSYAFTDDLAGLIEYSTYDVEGGTEPDEPFALELIYTF